MSKETGGPAFPHRLGPSGNCYNGMTLCDYFAAAALQGIMGNAALTGQFAGTAKDRAAAAFEMADAMLAERGERNENS